MSAFRNILRLLLGDFVAKTLYFLSLIYLARVLGVEIYGVLEFTLSILTYFLLLADGGIELWVTREAARGRDMIPLAGQILPLRLILAVAAYLVLLLLLPLFPDYPSLQTLLVLFGLLLVVQALNLKWAFMGTEQMTRVVGGLMLSQVAFAMVVFLFIRTPQGLVWVPIVRLLSELLMVPYFWFLFRRNYGRIRWRISFAESRRILRPAVAMGASHGLAQVSYNFDTVLLGFLRNAMEVGWYNAAYRPITALLGVPVSYFLGLFPVLSRTYHEDLDEYRALVARSLRLMAIFGIPIGVGGMMLAGPALDFMYGAAFRNSVLPLQILAWSAALVIIRGTYRQAFNAAGRHDLDLRCAACATGLNIGLNALLIPFYGVVGAASATLASEITWLFLASLLFYRNVIPLTLPRLLIQPALGSAFMAGVLIFTASLFWPFRVVIGAAAYFLALLVLGEPEVRAWLGMLRAAGATPTPQPTRQPTRHTTTGES